jgi:hypothetical protein
MVDLWSSVNGITSDAVRNAFQFTVRDADYFGSGISPIGRKHGAFLVRNSWALLVD